MQYIAYACVILRMEKEGTLIIQDNHSIFYKDNHSIYSVIIFVKTGDLMLWYIIANYRKEFSLIYMPHTACHRSQRVCKLAHHDHQHA